MRIHINGQAQDLPTNTTLLQLLEHHGYGSRRVAVEINLEIVPKSVHAKCLLKDGDRIEIVQAVGGG